MLPRLATAARRHIGEPGCDPAAGNLLPQNDCPLVVEADQMQGILARVDANGACDCNGCLMGHSDVLLVLLSPRSFSEQFGAGARPVHPILGRGAMSDLSPECESKRKSANRKSLNADSKFFFIAWERHANREFYLTAASS